MQSTLIIICIVFLASLSAMLSNDKKLFDHSYSKFKRVTKRGYTIILINLSIIILSVFQYYINEDESNRRDKNQIKVYTESVEKMKNNEDKNYLQLKDNYDYSTFLLKSRYDTSTTNIISALAKYGLKYDSAKRIIDKLKRLTSNPDPVLQLESNGQVTVDTVLQNYSINYISKDAGSTNFDIKTYIAAEFNNGSTEYIGYVRAIPYSSRIAMNEGLGFTMHYSKIFKNLYLKISGNYTNLDNSRTYNVNIIYTYDYLNKQQGTLYGYALVKWQTFFNSQTPGKKIIEPKL